MRSTTSLLLVLALLILTGCSAFGEKEDETLSWSPSKFYSEAKSALDADDYEKAIEYYEKLQARYPFGTYAQQAQLDMAYAYYKSDEPESAIAAADRYIKLYPSDPHVDYAYYLKGLTNFNRGPGFLEGLLPTDRSQRDPGAAKNSFADFSTLVNRYPGSIYAEDSRLRMIYLRNNLSMYEVHVANYYMKRKAYLAAANRAENVVKNFQETPAVPYALRVMTNAYQAMDMPVLAKDADRVLAQNFPEHPSHTQGAMLPKVEHKGLFSFLGVLDEN